MMPLLAHLVLAAGILARPVYCAAEKPGFFDSMCPPHVSASTREWSISSAGLTNCSPTCGFDLDPVFRILDKRTGISRLLAIDSPMVQGQQIFITPSGVAVILGVASGDLDAVAFVDLRRAKTVDAFPCYFPKISPDDRYVAFVEFFPPHAEEPKYTSFVYGVYDTRTGPHSDSRWKAGRPVYPLKNFQLKAFDPIGVTSEGSAHFIGMQIRNQIFLWQSPTSFEFIDEVGGRYSLVNVDLSRGLINAQVRITPTKP
jgi:hypothetical protein